MPDRKVSDFSSLITITNNNSVFHILDEDEGDLSDKNKKITFADLVSNIETIITPSGEAKVSSNDTTPDFLFNKILGGTEITVTENNDGGVETLTISFDGVATDELVKISSNDTTSDYLLNKIVVGSSGNLQLTELNDAADEDLEIEYIGFPQLVAEATGTINANNKELIPVDVSAGTATVNPPSTPSAGFRFAVSDSRSNAATNNITVDFVTATDNFHGASANHVVSVDKGYAEFIYVNATVGWILK